MSRAPLSQQEVDAKKIAKLQEQIKFYKGLSTKLLKNTGLSFETAIEEFKGFLAVENPGKVFPCKFEVLPPHKPKTKSVFDEDHSEVAVLPISDIHLSEVVAPLELNGMNVYDPMVSANRLWLLLEKFMRIVRGHQAMYSVEKIWVPLLGDNISGSIHQELVLTNALLDLPATVLVSRLLIMAILRLKVLGLPIEIDGIVGNHPRQTVAMTTKKQAHLSYDWMVYVAVADYFRNDPQVTVRIWQGQFGIVNIRGHRIVIEHGYGQGFKNIDELEAKIRNIFDSPTYREATGLEGSAVDFVLLGDKHRATYGRGYIVNGGLVGASEITTSWRLSPIRAVQMAFGISDNNVPSWMYPLDVTTERSSKVKNLFSSYTKSFMDEHGR